MKVKYTGTADFKEFDSADFKKAGLENSQRKVQFEQGVPLEVLDETAEALVSKEGLFHDEPFELVDEDEELPVSNAGATSTPVPKVPANPGASLTQGTGTGKTS